MAYELRRTNEFEQWIESLDRVNANRISVHLDRAESGNFGDHKSAGNGVLEMRIDVGPGFRLYYCEVEKTVYLLLAGGYKNTQKADIKRAKKIRDRELKNER